MGKVIGIDLGTTNSVISIVSGEDVRVIPNAQGNLTTPSIVAYANDNILVGNPAKNQAVTNPTKTVASVKRIIGQRFEEKSVSEFKKTVPYPVVGKKGDAAKVKIDEVELLPQEISALVLRELKQSAEDNLGEVITDVVITVPAYFNDSQRQATKDAGAIAGLNVKRIINEPTAAALAYGFKETGEEAVIAVFDLGGGTFDISVLEIGGGILEVKSTNGNTYLGGDDFDQVITKFLLHKFKRETGIDLSKDVTALSRLKEASEKAKCELSQTLSTNVNLPFVASNAEGPVHLNVDITRSQFEALIKPFMSEIEKCCKKALSDAELTAKEINNVILVGGSTRVPLVRELVKKVFSREPDTSVNPDEVVARGAAIQGAIITGEETRMVLLDVTPLSLGIETSDEEMDVLIPRNTTIPVSVTEIYTTQEDDQELVDVVVYQGEHHRASRNRLLGQFELGGIEPADAGDPQIEVRFDIDVNGILTVSAKDMDTGAERSVRIENSSKLSDDQISKMQHDAEQHQEEDRQYVATKQMQIDAESFLEQTEVGIQEFAELLNAEEMEGLKIAHAQLKTAYEADPVDTGALQSAINDIDAIWKYILEKQES